MGTLSDPARQILHKIPDVNRQLVDVFAVRLDNIEAMAIAGAGIAQSPTTPVVGAPQSNPRYFKLAGETNNAPLWQGAGVYWYSDNGTTRTGYIDMTTATVMELVNPADSALAIHLKSYENDSSGIVSTIHHYGRDDGDAEQEYARQHVIVNAAGAAAEQGEFQWQLIEDGSFPSSLNQMRLTGGRTIATDLYVQSEMGSDTNEFATIQFWARDSQPANEQYAAINATIVDNTTTTEDGSLYFSIVKAGTVTKIVEILSSKVTIDADLEFTGAQSITTSTGDLTIDSGGNFVVQDATIIDITGTEALLIRKNSDGGDIFIVDTTNSDVTINAPAGSSGSLFLTTGELTVVDGDILGRIDFQAPLESSGSDAILVGASMWAEADAEFTASVNKTELVFATAETATATERMRLTWDGLLGIGTSTPEKQLHISGAASAEVTVEKTSGGAGGEFNFRLSGSDVDVGTFLGGFDWEGRVSSTNLLFSRITSNVETANTQDSNLRFLTSNGSNPTEKMRIQADGTVSFFDNNITNVGEIDLDLIRADAANGSITIELDDAAGADLLVGNNNALVVEGDNDFVGMGLAAPDNKLHVQGSTATTINYLVKLSHGDGVTGGSDGPGILFNTSTNAGRGKGAIAYICLASFDRGDFVFLNDSAADTNPAAIGDEVMRIANDGNVGIGGASPTNSTLLSVEDGITFKESSAPTADATYGKIWTTDVNELFFQSGDGTSHLLHGDSFSNIWFHGSTTGSLTVEVVISTQNAMTKIDSFTVVGHEDDLSNLVGSSANNTLTLSSIGGGEYEVSYQASMTATGGADKEMVVALGIVLATAKDITNVTDDTVTPIVITSTAHGLEDGDMVEIVGVLGNTAAVGSFMVDGKTTDTFKIVKLDGSATTGNGDFDEGSPTGDITITYPGNMIIHREVRGATLGAISATGLHILADNDVLSLYVANLDGTTNLTISSISFDAFRIGD